MKIIKTMLTIVLLYFVVRYLIGFLLPNNESILPLINTLLIGVLLMGVLPLVLGRGDSKALKGLTRSIGLTVALIIFTVALAFLTGTADNIVATFIKEIIPFGRIIASAFYILETSLQSEIAIMTPLDFLINTARLILSTLLFPIITMAINILVFADKFDGESSSFDTHLNSVMPVSSKDIRKGSFRLSDLIAKFFAALYSSYASALIFVGLARILREVGFVGDSPIVIILLIIISGLFLTIIFSPVSRFGVGRLGVLAKLLISLGVMIAINLGIVGLIRIFVGTAG